ncbi:hypothetical protein KVT40_006332 [Elsinoe batatas]|uniref:MYND-type domain-containing protein n=1 Tax=Elsinoe batatas TaxID=2601811 RepID=A0A8K0KXG5_9PEZI|nr:hypothetical protein KVT40_006332 [Elsinoe batatas]
MSSARTVCGNQATQICGGFAGAPDAAYQGSMSVKYCGKECLQSAFPTHKTACKATRYPRATQLLCDSLKRMILIYHELDIGDAFQFIKKVGDKVHVRYSNPSLETASRKIRGGHGYILPEPDWSSLTLDDQEKLLSFDYSIERLAIVHHIAVDLLSDVVEGQKDGDMKVPDFIPRNLCLSVQKDNSDLEQAQERFHTVLHLTPKHNESAIADFCGGQYGHSEVVYSAKDYISTNSAKVIKTQTLDANLKRVLDSLDFAY